RLEVREDVVVSGARAMNADSRRERWRRVEELYHAAMGLSADARAAFLTEACGGDVQLQHEIEALVSVAPHAEHFLEPGGPGRVDIVDTPARVMTGWLVGHRVGPYIVKAVLGAGGMGEVYRATDTRLGRDVAMKVLPLAFSTDTERVRRFEQEARAAAGLNHPNILAVFDVGTHEGALYLVSELLDGETLRDAL